MQTVAAREDALIVQGANFVEIIVAPAGGQLELSEIVTRLAERRLLLDIVGEEAVVRRIRICGASSRSSDRGRITRRGQGL